MRENTGDPEVVRRLFLRPEFELMPFRSAIDQIDFLPEAATVTITASPAKGIEPTLEYATKLAQRGFDVIPHIAARSIADGTHLSRILDAIAEASIFSFVLVKRLSRPSFVSERPCLRASIVFK